MAIEYINKEYYQTIPKAERRYLNVGSQETAAAVIAKLKEANISFSASIGSRNTITLSGDNNLKIAKEYLADIANASTRNVIGNAAYRALSDKKYIKTDAETANILNSMLAGDNNIKFSGVIQGDSATITVSGNDNVNLVKRLISNIRNKELFEHITDAGFTRLPDKDGFINFKNNATGEVCGFDNVDMIKEMFYDENNEFFHPTIYRIELTSDAFEDVYYISAVDSTTLEEKHPYNTDDGMPTFSSIAEAISYAAANGIEYTNSNDEIEKWKAIDEEIAADNDLFKQNKELIKRFPEQNGEYPNDFMYNPDSNSYSWVYFNPDGDNGNGEFVEITVTENDVFEAYQKQLISEQNASGENAFIDYLYSICKENIIDVHSGYFEGYADSYINKPGIANRFYDSTDMTAMIDYLKINNHLIKNTTSAITAESDNIRLDGYTGSWYVIDNEVIDGKELFLLESEIYGDETACIIIDSSRNVVMDDVWNGFGDYRERFDVKELTAEEKFAAKVIAEWEAFRNRMSKESPEVLINSAYEISTKEQIKNYIETEPLDLTKQQLNALEERDNILDELYSEWIGNEYLHSYSDVETLLTNTADLINSVSIKEEKESDEHINSPVGNLNSVSSNENAVGIEDKSEYITITCEYSESTAFEDGKTYSVAEFDRIMAEADAERVNGWNNGLKKYGSEEAFEQMDNEGYYKYLGYQKTRFTINFPNGIKISERQDIGDGFGGVIDYCKTFSSLQQYIPLLEAQRNLDNTISERNEQNAIRQELEKDRQEIEKERVNVPVYAKSIAEARMNDEIELFRASQNANAACARDIDEALSRNYNNNSIDSKTALSELLEKYSSERIELVVAVNIASRPLDSRIYKHNKEWANAVLANFSEDIKRRNGEINISANPGLINLFANTIADYREKQNEIENQTSESEKELEDAARDASALNTQTETKDNSSTLIVNIYGGPGAGKSTTALQLAAELKKRGYHAEYVSEVAKDYVYAKNFDMLDGSLEHQKQIFSEQKQRVDLMIGNVDIAITDSPLTLNTIYMNPDEITPEYKSYILNEYNSYNNYNIYVERDMSVEFEQEGRIHNLSESIEKDREIKAMLISSNIAFDEFDRNNITGIADKVSSSLKSLLKDNANSPVGNLSGNEEKQLETAKEYIRNYLEKEFLSENVTFDDLEHISAGYTELGENNEYGFQMEIDLINLKIRYMLDDELVKEESYDSLEKMNELALSGINFDEFYSIGTDAISEAIKDNEITENDNTPKYYIYQIPAGERYRDIRFTSFDHLQIMGQLPDRMNYENIYSGELMDINDSNKLEGIFVKFNLEHPDDFKGHSLSVSDIIVIEDENGKSAHFVDSVGFKDITDIFFEHERKEQTVEQLNINDYENIRLVSRSEWNDRTLGDDENPAFEEISVSYTPDEDGSFTKYAHNTTNSSLVDVWDEENSVSADELLENIANHLKMMGQDNVNRSYHIELTDYEGNFHKLESNNYSFVQEDTQREQSEMTAPDVELEKSVEEGIVGSMGYPIDEMDKAFEAENSRTDYGNEAEPARRKPGNKIEIGDRFLYKDREYTVTSEKGIYPDDIGISYFDSLSNGRKYEVTENVDKNKLLREGEYLGNDINQTPEKTTEDATRDNSIPDKYLEKIEQNKKENIEFAESLSEFLSNTTPNNTHITIGRTPNSLILAGATPELDLIIRPDTIVKCMREATADEHGHLLTEEMLKALPDELRNPTIILKGSHENSIVAVTELKDSENREIIVSVEFNSRQDFGVVNRITSAYGKDNFQNYLNREIYEKNNLIAVNKNKANEMLQSFGLQLPTEETFISFDNSIAYTLDNVKFTTTNKEKADKMSSSTRLQLPAGNNIISSNKSIAHSLDNVKYPDEKNISNEEKSIESNDMQSEQLSLFSNAPSRKSVDEAFSELYDTSEERPASQDDSLLTFSEQVDKVLNCTANRYNDLKVCDTPQILLDVGCEQLPMLYTQQHLRKAIQPKNLTEHTHGLDIDQIKNLPSDIANPVMILDSTSRNDSILLVLSQIDKENCPLLVSVKPNGNGKYNLDVVDSNFITSVYGRENFASFIERNIELDNILFYNKEKSQELFRVLRLQFPQGVNNLDSNTIIHQSRNIVNTKENIFFKNTTTNQQKEKSTIENNGQDFVIKSDDFNEKKAGQGEKARYADNVAAIRLLKKIEGENRKATPDEQEILAKYVGWGGIQNAFDSSRNEWRNEYAELKELLNEAEYKAARASTNNAHFTSPVIINAIYNGLRNIGFNGGKILEPSAGTGNFFGAMPEDIKNGSELFGVELDSITGRIAQQLYQSADIQVNGFEKTTFENNSFDAVVSNVPFGDYKLYDREYNHLNLNIHDYFFAKALDKVHPGGVVAFVTSSGTMDKQNSEVRKYLAERAELLGAIRLPNNAFKGIAGTEVTSDIIFLQKREYPIAINENNASWLNRQINDDGIVLNQYFAEHPEMVLGKMVEGNKMYGSGTTCMPIEGANLKDQLAEAVKNIQGQYKEYTPKQKNEKTQPTVTAPADVKTFSYAILDDKLYFRKGGTEMEEVTGKELERCKAMTEIRDTVRKLLNMQIKNIDGNFEADIVSQRQLLNTKYDDFVSKFGLLTSKHNAAVYKADASYNLLKALEKTDSDGNFIGKADVFTRNTINPIVLKDHVDTADEALILSVAEKLTVDMQYMQEITGMTEEQLVSELVGKIYQNPAKGMQWESADEYLTGNVRQKLKEAIAANMPGNVAALERVIPEKIEAQDIAVKLGASWIDPEYIREFVIDEFRPDWSTQRSLTINYSKYTDTWSVDGYSGNFNVASNETYGDWGKRFCGYKLLEMALNMKKPEVKKELVDPETQEVVRDVKGNVVKTLDAEATAILQSKQEALVKRFSEWLMDDPTRREALVEKYNEMFNSIRHREYDGSHLNFVGINKEIELKPHQKDAIARALYSGNTLLAHEVGAGKTYEMVAIAMEGKRLGLHNKALFAVPKHLTEQTGQAFRELYPNCNILVATEKDFERKNRQELLAKIATGDYDAIIIGHSQFDRIHLSPEKEQQYITDELEMLRNALEEMSSDGKKSFSVKQIESAIKKKEKHLEELKDMIKADDFIEFEQLGVDKVFIDESQNYKNLGIVTKMQNVAGLGSGESAKASQLLMKCKYLDELTGNKGIVFASGTPISNSMTEMYSLMRYLQADKLESVGITSFDRWASVFGETKTEMELKPTADGQYQLKTRFAKFSNLPELMGMFKECADIKTAATLDLDRPDRHDHTIVVEPNRYQQKYIKNIGERAEAIHSGTIDPRIDNMLKITTDGRKIGLDSRCIDPNAPDDPGSKVNTCIENVYKIWEETAENRSTQMIFCDLATPQAPINESTYIVYRKDENGDYAPIYSDKLKANEGVSEIFKKLSEKPSKEFIAQADVLRDTDIILTKEVNVKEELSYNNMGIIQQGKIKAVPDTSPLYDKIGVSPISTFESEKRFCVYDDIRNKLIAKGVPKEEIAFIHEYEKAADKQKLFEKMNKGEVRIMLGSTQKCGAGMNAQKKMIALHDLDAPLRPSDMGQRHGRIERQGNENKDIDIYRYVTNRTFDAYIYQTLENKQKFISQIMTEKSPVRSCDDIDEFVLDYAETKALCAGNPLIKERLTLQTEIKQLEVLKSGYLSQRYALQKVIADYPDNKVNYENRVAKIEQDISRVEEPMVNEEGKKYNPITIGDKTYADKEEGGQAMRKAISDNMEALYSGRAVTIGKYRGFELSVAPNGQELNGRIRINLCLTGEAKHYCDVNLDTTVQAGGNIVRLNNLINGFESELTNAQEKLENLNTNYETTKEKVDKPFEKEAELNAKQQRLKEVEAELMSASSINVIDTSEIYNQIVSICPALETDESVCQKYKAQGYEPLSIEKEGNACVIMHTYVQNGDLMYDPAITFNIDTENHTIEVTSFEQSGLGMYEDFRDNASGLKDCVEFFEQWLDNINQQGFKAVDMSAEKEEEPDIEPEMPQYNNYSIR